MFFSLVGEMEFYLAVETCKLMFLLRRVLELFNIFINCFLKIYN